MDAPESAVSCCAKRTPGASHSFTRIATIRLCRWNRSPPPLTDLARPHRSKLSENEEVLFVGYKIPHPLVHSFELKVPDPRALGQKGGNGGWHARVERVVEAVWGQDGGGEVPRRDSGTPERSRERPDRERDTTLPDRDRTLACHRGTPDRDT